MGWYTYDRPKPRRPANGIKAQTQTGKFGKTWWAGRWIAALEGLVDSGRLSRGRSYARNGQVVSLDVGPRGRRGAGPGKSAEALQGEHPVPAADGRRVGEGRRGDGRRGDLRGAAPQRRDARGRREGLRGGGRDPLSGPAERPRDRLLLPGLVEPLQARRRGALPPRRAVRGRPLPDVRAAGPRQGRDRRGAPRQAHGGARREPSARPKRRPRRSSRSRRSRSRWTRSGRRRRDSQTSRSASSRRRWTRSRSSGSDRQPSGEASATSRP